MNRRELLAATGATGVAVLAGCLGEDGGLPEDTETVLDALPDSVGGESVVSVILIRPQTDEDRVLPAEFVSGLQTELGVSPGTAALVGVAYVGGFQQRIRIVTGSFTAEELSDPREEAAVDGRDGLLLTATDDGEPWADGLTAAQAAADDPAAGLIGTPAKRLIEPLADDEFVTARPTPREGQIDERIEMYAYSQSVLDESRTRTRYSILFESEAAVSDSVVREIVGTDSEESDGEDIEVTQDGRRVVAEVTTDSAPADSSEGRVE